MSQRSDIRGVRGTLGVLAAIGLLAHASADAASARIVEPIRWGAPLHIAPQGGLVGITCPSTTLCVATNATGDVVASTEPAGGAEGWHSAHVGSTSLDSVSCTASDFCLAADAAGDAYTSFDPTGGDGAWSGYVFDAEPHGFKGPSPRVSCVSASLCVAVDLAGQALVSSAPATGAASWRAATIDAGSCPLAAGCWQVGPSPTLRNLTSVSCPSASLCLAGDLDGYLFVTTDPADASPVWSSAYVDPTRTPGYTGLSGNAKIADISCWGPEAQCAISDVTGWYATSSAPAASAAAWRDARAVTYTGAFGSGGFTSLSCPSASLCAAVYQRSRPAPAPAEVALTHRPLSGHEWETTSLDPGGKLVGVSCPSAQLCLAVDGEGNVILGRATAPGRAAVWSYLLAQLRDGTRHVSARALRRLAATQVTLAPPAQGRLRLRLLLSSGPRARRLVAECSATSGESETVRLALRATRAGRSRLRGARSPVRLVAELTFWPLTGSPVTAVSRVAISR